MADRRPFAPIAATLREEVTAFYERRGTPLAGPAGVNTLETNSGLVERRSQVLLDLLAAHRGSADLSGAAVIDVGCGFGAMSARLAAEGADVTAIDPEAERFEVGEAVSRRHDLGVRFVQARMEALEVLPHARFDVAVINNSLCYVTAAQARSRALREVLRVLRPAGWAVLRDPNRLSLVDPFTGLPLVAMLPARRAGAVAARLGRPRSQVLLATPARAADDFRAAGFDHVRAGGPGRGALPRTLSRYHHLVARRPPA